MTSTAARVAQALGLARSEQPPTTPPQGSGVMPPARPDHAVVTPRQAMTLDAVFRAVQVLHTAATQLSFDVWRQDRKLTDSQRPSVTLTPDVFTDTTLDVFLGETVIALATRGNAYWKLTRGSDGQVLNARPLDPMTVQPRYTSSGQKRFTYDGRDDWTPADIAHMRFLTIPGEAAGLGPIQAAARTLSGAVARSSYADTWFDTGSVPNGVLKSDQALTAAQAEEYKKRWQETQSYTNGPAVLGSGLDYRPLMLKPSEVQWLEAQEFGVTGVARLFGMPASYIHAAVEGSSRTYANQEQEDIAFVRFTLMGYLRPIETAMTQVLPRGQHARLNVDALLRTDTKSRYEAHQIGLNAGFLSVPEVRAIEGLDPDVIPEPTQKPAPAPATQESA